VVVNTVALNADHNVWDIMTVNTTSMMYLTMLWYNKSSVRHIINVSSTSTYWVSYPGIEDGRFAYNFSKWCVSHFGRELNRKIMDDPQAVISTVELGSFASKFNSHAIGRMNLQQAADTVLSVINNPVTAVSRIH
jgi:NAD(P)-dependent dehydrogenase (short-subunit alcohol dehydrogenase family)